MLAGGPSTLKRRRMAQPQGQWVWTELQHQDGAELQRPGSAARRRTPDAGRDGCWRSPVAEMVDLDDSRHDERWIYGKEWMCTGRWAT
jgi:hypothetical protein